MDRKAIRYAAVSQLSLYFFMGLCIVLNPHFAFQADEGGLSNYGLYAKTVIPYTIGMTLCGWFIFRARQYLPQDIAFSGLINGLLLLVSLFFILELLSTYPYKINSTFKDVHFAIGACLLVTETLICALTSFSLRKGLANKLLFMVQLLGLALVTLALMNVLHILLVAELVAGLAFAVALHRMMTIISQETFEHQKYDKLIHSS